MACIATTIVYTRGFACPRTPAREVHHGPRSTHTTRITVLGYSMEAPQVVLASGETVKNTLLERQEQHWPRARDATCAEY